MPTLIDAMTWTRFPVPAGAAVGQVELAVGQVGNRSPIALITAGIHGDEGPWGSWAIHKFLAQTSLDDLRGSLRVEPVANPLAMEAVTRNALLHTPELHQVYSGDAHA